MRRFLILIYLLFISALAFGLQDLNFVIIGGIPAPDDGRFYQIQVGAFGSIENAENAFNRLRGISLNPVYEQYRGLTRVIAKGIRARDIPFTLERIQSAGFREATIRIDPDTQPAAALPAYAPPPATAPAAAAPPATAPAAKPPAATAPQTSPAIAQDLPRSITELPGRITELQGKVTEIPASITELRNKITELQNTVGEVPLSISELKGTIAELQDSIAQLQDTVAELQAAERKPVVIQMPAMETPTARETPPPVTEAPRAAPQPAPAPFPVSTAKLPSKDLLEIGHCIIHVGEILNLAEFVPGRNVKTWISSTPEAVTVDRDGKITGHSTGNGYILINDLEYISVAIVPQENFSAVPEDGKALLPPDSRTGLATTLSITEYRTEPTFRLAYRYANTNEFRGASGRNGGIDILARGANYEWLCTTFNQGGWFYDLNGTNRQMVNGYQKDSDNGVELRLVPDFVYKDGIAFLRLKHELHNPNNHPVSHQKFGATADIMLHNNDNATLTLTPYGAHMVDSLTDPSIEIIFVCITGNGISPVDTLWLGTWDSGKHINNIYSNSRADVPNQDSAIAFSYQDIDLAAGETKEFIVWFTLARSDAFAK